MTYRSKALKRWPKAEWIHGEGKYALLAPCRVLTVSLWPTMKEAKESKKSIDETGCGGECHASHHEIVDMDAPTRIQARHCMGCIIFDECKVKAAKKAPKKSSK